MNFLEKFLVALQVKMSEPTLYGWFHILWLTIIALGVVAVCLTCKKLNDKQFRIFLAITGGVLIVLEILKQLVHAFDVDTLTWDYAWKQFPFQFCSVPMYVALIVASLKECKFRDYLCSFLATFGLFAGAIVMIYPSTVLSDIIFRTTQSFVHHGAMIIIGVLIWVCGKAKVEHKTILKAIPVFAVCVAAAFIMNIVFHATGNTDSFNMFYIGPYNDCDIPVLSSIGEALNIASGNISFGNFLFLFIYVLGFSIAAYIILLLVMLINHILNKKQLKKETNQ